MKIKMYCHNDLDGVGGPIIAGHVFGQENVNFELCNYTEINQKVKDFILSPEIEKYDHVFITDISVNEEVARLIEGVEGVQYGMFQLIDHHSTAEWLNKYDWAEVHEIDEAGKKTSGTSLFYNWLVVNDYYDGDMLLEDFAELVRSYDSWDWTVTNNQHAKRLNDLLFILGHSKFLKRFAENMNPNFTEAETLLLDIEEEKIEKYIESKGKTMYRDVFNGDTAGVVFAEQYISQLGNKLSELNPDLDYIVIINPAKGLVSYRTIHQHVNVAEVAKKNGGGGHPQASGSAYDVAYNKELVCRVFGV